ncbi:MAG: hypothetical protein NVV68_04585 [Dokdonella sp.]|nr:hypothetical protein [Dokdonella sp.]
MNKTNISTMPLHARPARNALALATALALAGLAAPAAAISFGNDDGFHGTLNTTLSYGISVRVQDRDST